MTDEHTTNTDHQPTEQAPAPTKDLPAWEQALAEMPTADDATGLWAEVERIREVLAEAETAYHRAIVQRACVRGFTRTAGEIGVSARQVRVWHHKFPELVDLSEVPQKEMQRQGKAIGRLQDAQPDDLAEQIAQHTRALNAIRKGMSK